jgi:putative ABC transport system permease protein
MLQILSTLRRHRTASIMIVLEIALTCAIVCNAVFLIRERLARMDQPSGVPEDELMQIHLSGIGTSDNADVITEQDLAALRALPGVKAATSIDMVPFGGSSWNSDVSKVPDSPDGPNCGTYQGRDLIKTLGLHLIAGRDFLPEEYIPGESSDPRNPKQVIVTKAMADYFYPDGALGKPLYASLYALSKEPQIIVGVVERLARPNVDWAPEFKDFAYLLPITVPYTVGHRYVVRFDPSQRDAVFGAIDATLNKIDPNRLIHDKLTFGQIRRDHFKADRSMAWLLASVSLALLVITALGVVGLASFWVQQRTRQIGVRRALGATRGDILRYFQLENFILATLGIAIGMGMAFGVNVILMHEYAIPRLPGSYLPIGAALLWLLGQIAVLGPALRASLVPPAVATRTV